jgi:parallel beta-helix repeat protein
MKNSNYLKTWLIIVSIILFAAGVFSDVLAQSGAWTKKADLPKGGGSASVVDGKIYVFGGSIFPGITDVAYNVVYDPLTNTWEEKASMPTARGFLTTAVINDTIYAIGGGYPTSTKKVEAYDPVTNTWATKADMLNNRLGMEAAVVDGIIYIFGGNYNQHNCQAYNPNTNIWEEKAPIPDGSGGGVSVTAYNGLIYIFGGSTYSPWAPLSKVYVYNPQTDTYTPKKDMPTARFKLQTYLVGEKIYAIGGSQSQNTSVSTVEVYDPVADTWETKPNMPHNRAWFTGAVVNDKIYIIGGTPNWSTPDYSVWEYDPSFNTLIAGGNVSGTWTLASSPYHIDGEITVPNGETLTIESGVEVVFMGHHKFNVQGRLLAVATQQNPILFTAEDKAAGWHGIRFINTPASNDTSKLIHCSLKYGKANTGSGLDRSGGAIMINRFDKVFISDCLFESNMTSGDVGTTGGPGVCIFYGSPTVTKSTFINNSGTSGSAGAIKVDFTSNAVISNNIISNNTSSWGAIICAYQSDNKPTISGNIISDNVSTVAAGGILVYSYAQPRIENNIIINNQASTGGGIYCFDNVNPVLINNTIANNSAGNGGGINFGDNSDGIFINNIIYGNTATSLGDQVYINDAASDPIFKFNDIQGGKEEFGGSGGINYDTARYKNNIDYNPLFYNAISDNYRLSNSSRCIGSGVDSLFVEGQWIKAPSRCIHGLSRPFPVGSNPDIGACESFLGVPDIPDGLEEEIITPSEFTLYQNYPNPFNPTTTIKYSIPTQSPLRGGVRGGYVTLKVFDILGNEIATLVNEEKTAGTYEVEFTGHTDGGQSLSSGVYFYTLKAGDFTATKKLLLLK